MPLLIGPILKAVIAINTVIVPICQSETIIVIRDNYEGRLMLKETVLNQAREIIEILVDNRNASQQSRPRTNEGTKKKLSKELREIKEEK